MIAPFAERARSASRSSPGSDWAADGTPPTGRVLWRGPAPLSYGEGTVVAAWATPPAVLVFRIERAAQAISPTRKPRHLTQRMTGSRHFIAVRGRSHKQCEQFNHANSDHEHGECHGIIVQPVQPLLHGTPPCSPTLGEREDPRNNASGGLAFPCPPGIRLFTVGISAGEDRAKQIAFQRASEWLNGGAQLTVKSKARVRSPCIVTERLTGASQSLPVNPALRPWRIQPYTSGALGHSAQD